MKNIISLTFLFCALVFSTNIFSQEQSNIELATKQDRFLNILNETTNTKFVLIPGKYLSSEELKQIYRLINEPGKSQYQMTPLFSNEDSFFCLV